MKEIPFTSYDFWGYLTSGFVLLFVADHVVDTHLIVRDAWPTSEALIAIACAYCVGHILAGLSSWLWEGKLMRRWTGIPTNILMGEKHGPWVLRTFCSGYYGSLPKETRAWILTKAEGSGVTKVGEGLFWLAFGATRADAAAQRRMENFLNQYGLCRNLSFTTCICAVVLLFATLTHRHPYDGWWAALAAFLSVAMYLRYMKFYRHYAIEVLTTYAHAK